jgi:hypothetical protein
MILQLAPLVTIATTQMKVFALLVNARRTRTAKILKFAIPCLHVRPCLVALLLLIQMTKIVADLILLRLTQQLALELNSVLANSVLPVLHQLEASTRLAKTKVI